MTLTQMRNGEPWYADASLPTVTRADLEWWWQLAPTLAWRSARTMPQYPHSYVIRGEMLSEDDYLRAMAVVQTFGVPGRFYERVQIYLYDEHEEIRWWLMSHDPRNSRVLNMATTDVDYGPQDAPDTRSRTTADTTLYDGISAHYDSLYEHDRYQTENRQIAQRIAQHFGAFAPSVLDVGCGTGLLLDLGITSPSLYTGVDPSQGMLNQLVVKHPTALRVVPSRIEEVPENTLTGYDLVTALFGSASHVTDHAVARLFSQVSVGGMLILMHYDGDYLPAYYGGAEPPEHRRSRDRAAAMARDLGGSTEQFSDFQMTVITR